MSEMPQRLSGLRFVSMVGEGTRCVVAGLANPRQSLNYPGPVRIEIELAVEYFGVDAVETADALRRFLTEREDATFLYLDPGDGDARLIRDDGPYWAIDARTTVGSSTDSNRCTTPEEDAAAHARRFRLDENGNPYR